MKSDPKELAEIATRQKVFNLALQGFDVAGIAAAANITEDMVRIHVTDIRADLTLRMQEAQELWVAMNVARTEKILSKIMPIFDQLDMPVVKGSYTEGEMSLQAYVGLIGDAAKIFTSIAKLQKEILQIKLDNGAASTKYVQNNTILASSDFYKEAMDAMQREMFGATWDEYQEQAEDLNDVLPVLDEDPRLIKVEKAIAKLMPPDDNEDEA